MKPLNFLHNFKIFLLVIRMNARSFLIRKSTWFSLFLFSLTLLFLFPFAFGTDLLHKFDVQIGCYWMIQEFLAALLILNMFKLEEEGHADTVYAATRSSRIAFFFGKVIFTTVHFLSLQIPLTLLWVIIFNIEWNVIFVLIPTLILSNIFFAFTASILGGFLYSITHRNSVKEILQPLLFFPLQSASLLASVGVCLQSQNNYITLSGSPWWNVIVFYPILFIGLTLIFGDTLLEE